MVAAAIKKSGNKPDALIQVLHVVQNIFGYLPMHVIEYVTQELRLPPSRVYGVATFYHFFSLKQKGEHTCMVCTGTACYVKGAQDILDAVEKHYGIKPGEVTKDNKLGLQIARCLGACGMAPVVVIDNEIIPKVQAKDIKSLIEERTGVKA
jgi:bidirectional [NiFe] hydrogenase diaphorase subunit